MPTLTINATTEEAAKLQDCMQSLYDEYSAAVTAMGQTPVGFLEWYRQRTITMIKADYKQEKKRQLIIAAGSPDEVVLT